MRFISALSRLEKSPFFDKTALLDPGVPPSGFGFGATSGSSTPALGGFGQPKISEQATLPKPATTGLFSTGFSDAGVGSKPTGGGLFGNFNTQATSTLFTTSTASYKGLSTFAKKNKNELKNLLTNDSQLVYEIHDILKAYYSTSVQHFTDTVCKIVLNQTFVNDTMNLFSEAFIKSLSDVEVARISAESVADRKIRRELNEDVERLEKAISESEAILSGSIIA
jgi:hypothetical protein